MNRAAHAIAHLTRNGLQRPALRSLDRVPRAGALAMTVILACAAPSAAAGLLADSVGSFKAGADLARRAAQEAAVAQAVAIITTEIASRPDLNTHAFPEPPPFVTASGAAGTYPAGGGLVPTGIGAPTTDGYGARLGYCAWQNGTAFTGGNRLPGSPSNPGAATFAVVSAGLDGVFTRTCAEIAAGTNITNDDFAVAKSTSQIRQGVGGTVYFADPVVDMTALGQLTGLKDGELRLVKADNTLWRWDVSLGTPAWVGAGTAYAANNVAITGGTINGTAIGNTTPSTGAFTSLSGTLTGNVSGNVTGNAATATKLLAPVLLGISGDASWSVSFDGSANVSAALTLASTGVTAGVYGGSTFSPVVQVDAKGRLVAAGNVLITPAWTSITGTPTTLSGYGIGTIDGTPIGLTVASSGAFTSLAGSTGSFTGAVSASSFAGSGAALTALNAGNITTGTLGVARGGTGQGTLPANGQLLIGTASGYTLANLTGGAGLSVTNGAGSITLANTGVTSLIGTTDQVLVSAGTGAVTLSLPQNIGITSSPTFAGLTVTGPQTFNGLTLTGGLIGTTGNFSGAVTAGSFSGVGTALTALDGSNLTSGTVAVARGGTGVGATPTNGQLLIGNGAGYTLANLTGGAGLSVTNGAGTITLANTGVISLAGTTDQVNVSGSTGAVTLSLPQSIGVTSSPTFAGLTLTGAPTFGGLTLTAGLNATTATFSGAVTAASFAGVGSALTGLDANNIGSGTLAVARGGTGLGAAPTNGQLLIGNGTGYTLANLTGGAGLSVTNGAGSITLANTGVTSFNTRTGAVILTLADVNGATNFAANNLTLGTGALSAGSTGTDNTAVGAGALAANTTGLYNTAIGSQALKSNTTGRYNVATGKDALQTSVDGWENVATGYQALYSNINGSDNVATGFNALYSNTNGGDNVATGFKAMYSNTTGSVNVANGNYALYSNTTGAYNVATGYFTLYDNTTGDENTAYGWSSLTHNTTGSRNTGVGQEVLRYNTTGNYNVGSGYLTLYHNTTGNNNVASGYLAGYTNNSITADNSTFIGANATIADNLIMGASGRITLLGADASASGLGAANANAYMTALGSGSSVTTANTVVLGRAADVTVIGATADDASGNKLQVTGAIKGSGNLTIGGTGAFTGAVTAASFAGSGAALTALNGSNVSSGTVGATFGGTGVNGGAAANGALLIGNGSGYTLANITGGTGLSVTNGAGTIALANTGVTSLKGTTNQVNISASTGAVTLSLPQSIAAVSTPTFAGLTLTGALTGTAATFSGVVSASAGTVGAPGHTFGGDLSTGLYLPAAGQLAASTAGTRSMWLTAGSIGIGAGALAVDSAAANANTAVGQSALGANTSGVSNIAVGALAMSTNITGGYNVAVGKSALFSTTTSSNTGIGDGALYLTSTGGGNVAVGRLAGHATSGNIATNSNTTGSNNTFLGSYAMPGTTTQLTYATALGSEALVSTANTIVLGRAATDKTVIGATGTDGSAFNLQVTGGIKAITGGLTVSAGQILAADGTVAAPGIAFGGETTTGFYRPAAGQLAASISGARSMFITGGNFSVGLGILALASQTTGQANTAIGHAAATSSSGGGGNTAIGFQTLYSNINGNDNTAVGVNALMVNGGSFNVAIGKNAGGGNTNGNNNTLLGTSADVVTNTLSFATALGSGATVSTGNTIVLGRAASDVTVIGATADDGSGNKLQVAGGISSTAALTALRANLSDGSGGVTYANMAVGTGALIAAPSGAGANTAIGPLALNVNLSGGHNTALGRSAANSNTSGSYNTALGRAALYRNTVGSSNTAVGVYAGNATSALDETNANISGSNNTFLGAYANAGTTTQLNYATALGSDALVTTGNTIVLGRTTDKTVIGATGNDGTAFTLQVTGGIKAVSGGFSVAGGDLVLGSASITGTLAARPAFGVANRIYIATDTNIIYRDTGTAWVTLGSSGGGAALSGLTAATVDNTIANGAFAQSWNWQLAANTAAFSLGESVASTGGTGTQYLTKIGTLAASTAIPMSVSSQGVEAFRVNNSTPQILANTGSKTAPTYSFAGSTNSGFYLENGNLAASVLSIRTLLVGNNTGLGQNALRDVTTSSGGSNVAVGGSALRLMLSGSNNVAIGGGTLPNSTLGDSNVALGASAGGTTNDYQGSSSVFIGSLARPASSSQMASVGRVTLIGADSSASLTSNGPASAFMTAIGSLASVTTINTVVLGRTTDKTVIGATGTATAGNANGATLQVIGTVGVTGSVTALSYVTSSDVRLKENISTLDRSDTLQRLKSLNGYRYNLIADPKKTPTYGVIAQEILGLFPDTVRTREDGFYAVDYGALSALAATAVGQLANNMDKYGLPSNGSNAGNGALLIGNGSGYTSSTLTAGAGIGIVNDAGKITIRNTGVTGFNGRTGNVTLTPEDVNGVTSFGNGNVTLGTGALVTTSTGGFNTASGQGALGSTDTGSGNAAQGYQSLYGNTSGANNTGVGRQAGYASRAGSSVNANLSGSNNTFIGAHALPGTAQQLNYASAIGADAVVTTSGTIVLGRSDDVTVLGAAGDDRSGNRLQVTGGIKATGTLSANALTLTSGNRKGVWIDNGAAAGAGNALVQAGDSTLLFSRGAADGAAGLVIGPWSSGSAGLRVSNNGVAVGGALVVNGPVSGSSAHAVASDIRFKKNVLQIDDALDVIGKLKGVRYEANQAAFPNRNFEAGRQLGLVAQQIEAFVPEVVRTDAEGYKSVQYSQLAPLLVEGIKAQQTVLKHLSLKDPATLLVDIKTFQGNDAVFDNIKTTHIKTVTLEAETARIKKLEAERIEARLVRSDVVKTGEMEVFVSMGSFQPIFAPQVDSQYIVNATAEDGSSAFASVAFMSGKITVTPISGKGVDVMAMGAQVGLVAASKKIKATWIRMS